MTKRGITLNLKTITFIVTICGVIFSAGVAWSSLDTQLVYVTKELTEIKANQKAMDEKLSALVLSDGELGERVDGVRRDVERLLP